MPEPLRALLAAVEVALHAGVEHIFNQDLGPACVAIAFEHFIGCRLHEVMAFRTQSGLHGGFHDMTKCGPSGDFSYVVWGLRKNIVCGCL